MLLLLFILSVVSVQAQQTGNQPPLVSVTGTGEVRVQPDQVVVNLGIETREKTLEAARKETDKKAAAIITYLKKKGVDERDVQTSYVNLHPIYSNNEYGRTTPDAYYAQKSMTVVVKNLKRFDELMSGLYDMGANNVHGINFKVSDEEKYRNEARKKAVANAREKAILLTGELNTKLGKVYSIDESSSGSPRPMYKMAMMESAAMDGAQGPSIAAGEVVITSNVNVSFVID